MRAAALYDVHGNLPALEAVLDEVVEASVDEIVVGGDVFPGPMSGACLERLLELELPVRFLRGNGDREMLALAEGDTVESVPPAVREAMAWEAQSLSSRQLEAISSWPMTVRLEMDRLGSVLFCHAAPRSDSEIFTCRTPADRLAIFEEAEAELVVSFVAIAPQDDRLRDCLPSPF